MSDEIMSPVELMAAATAVRRDAHEHVISEREAFACAQSRLSDAETRYSAACIIEQARQYDLACCLTNADPFATLPEMDEVTGTTPRP